MRFLWILEGLRNPFLDTIMQIITYFGQELVILAVICALYWCIDKRFAYLLGFTYFTAGLGVQALKITFRIPRPWILDPNFPPVKSAVSAATGYSFPSGHTQGATALYLPLALKTSKKWIRFFCILAFVLVGFSRMYLGVHTPKDVLTSMALTSITCFAIWHFQSVLLDQDKYLKTIAALLLLLSALIAVYSLLLYTNQTIEVKYVTDCCKAAGAGLGFAVGWYIERRFLNFSTHSKHPAAQIIKLIIGLIAALLIKECAGLFLGTSILAKMMEYFILVLWVLVLYPILFSKVQRRL